MRKNPSIVMGLALFCLAVLNAGAQTSERTFQVKEDGAPWYDRVGNWSLTDVPTSLESSADLPQQSCGDRSVAVDGASSLLVGVSEKDAEAFQQDNPAAKQLSDTLAVKSPTGMKINYVVFYVEAPPPKLKGDYKAGLILLGINVPFPDKASLAEPTPTPVTFETPTKDHLDVYLLMGQSNMLGRDESQLANQTLNPRIGSLDGKGKWVVAKDPLFGGSGTGMGISFAAAMLEKDPAETKIGLVQTAVGGTPLSRWVKGGDLYEKALARAKLAMQTGTLKGMLWHQGESDTNKPEDASSYEARLSKMFADLRADLGMPNLPIVVGQLGPFLTVKRQPYVEEVRKEIEQTAKDTPHVGYADSEGLKDKGDALHFTADAQREFGRRYAAAMQQL